MGLPLPTYFFGINYDDRYRYRSRLFFHKLDWKSFRYTLYFESGVKEWKLFLPTLWRGHPVNKWLGLFHLKLGIFYLRLVFVAYGQLAWSSLLTVEIRFGLVCLRWKIGLVFLTVSPVRKMGLVFFTYGSPCLEIGIVNFS